LTLDTNAEPITPILVKMIAGTAGVKDTLLSDALQIQDSTIALMRFLGLLDKDSGVLPVVTRSRRLKPLNQSMRQVLVQVVGVLRPA
jgi:hypothetical protein